MKERSAHLGARAIGYAMALAASVCVLAAVIWGLGTSEGLMQAQFARHAPPAATGLAAEHYPGVARMITGYLSGREADFQYTAAGAPLFRVDEQRHMADCLALFQLDRRVLVASALALAALMAGVVLLRDGRRVARGFFAGCTSVLAVMALAGIAGAVDFDRVFVLFHLLSFDNGLWLMDPAKDLLIRLMPTAFFVSYAAMGLGLWAGATALMACASGALGYRRKHKR